MTLEKEDIVRLAYQLILGREPVAEEEHFVKDFANFPDVQELRSWFVTSREYAIARTIDRCLNDVYSEMESEVSADTQRFESFLAIESPHLDVRDLVDRYQDEYSRFHSRRFVDQVRALIAIREKLLRNRQRLRVLDVGPATVSQMYIDAIGDIELTTCGNFEMKGFKFYEIDLDAASIPSKYPEFTNTPFDVVVMCEVIEHLRVSPQEIIEEASEILAPGGVLLISTPNAMSEDRMRRYLSGSHFQEVYERRNARRYIDRHIHVREFTLPELKTFSARAKVSLLYCGISDYFNETSTSLLRKRYSSARDQITLILRKG